MFTPAGMERFFEGVAELQTPFDPAAYRAIADAAWMKVLGPRLPRPTRCNSGWHRRPFGMGAPCPWSPH
ncbi:MAG: hypothetical protein JF886_13335 [Candidatus Dormibacteraeota bacterium]|nr:hypothetical protein [Candidatus Dormibacteraeota bacterium]